MSSILVKYASRLGLILVGMILPLAVLEGSVRLEHWFRKGTPLGINPSSQWDETLGWHGKEHILGTPSSSPILVLGDSFTDGLGVPADKMWFASLQAVFPERGVIAYGGLGYGTLQETMVLRDYLAKGLNPSLIVVQLCSNDIINNYLPLERESFLQRAPAPRPYLMSDNTIDVRLPRHYEWPIRTLISISRFAYKYNNRWDAKLANWANERKIDSIEFSISKEGFSNPVFSEALKVSNTLFSSLKEAAAGRKLVFMLVDHIEPYTAAIKGIAKRLGIPLLIPTHDYPIPQSEKLEDGAHLAEAGNATLGKMFVEQAIAKKVF